MSKIILKVMMIVTICCLIVTACRKDQGLGKQEAITHFPQGKIAKQVDVKDQARNGKVSFEIRADDPTILEWFDNECLTVQFDVPDDATDSEEAHEDLPASDLDKPAEIGQKFVSIRMSGIFAQDAATLEYYSSRSKNYSVRFSPALVEYLRANQVAAIIEFEDVKLTSTDRHCEDGCVLPWSVRRVKLYGDGGKINTTVKTYWSLINYDNFLFLGKHSFPISKMCDVCDHDKGYPEARLRMILTINDVLTGYDNFPHCIN